jgi:hypothetical protein
VFAFPTKDINTDNKRCVIKCQDMKVYRGAEIKLHIVLISTFLRASNQISASIAVPVCEGMPLDTRLEMSQLHKRLSRTGS